MTLQGAQHKNGTVLYDLITYTNVHWLLLNSILCYMPQVQQVHHLVHVAVYQYPLYLNQVSLCCLPFCIKKLNSFHDRLHPLTLNQLH